MDGADRREAMGHNREAADSRQLARKILPFLGSRDIPITPENYRIWYEYFIGEKTEVKEHLDDLLAKDTTFDSELNEELYERFFVRDHEKESTKKVQKELEVAGEVTSKASELIVNTIRDILAGSEITAEYGEKLEKYTTEVKGANSMEEVQKVLKSLVKDTHEAGNLNLETKEKMEESSSDLKALHLELMEAKDMARRDDLTGLHNRRFFNEEMDKQLEKVKNSDATCSMIMVDLDFFKRFNDTYGHLVGDKLLSTVSKEMKDTVPEACYVCRYGGEEFAIICPGIELDYAEELAEKVRKQIEEIEFTVKGTDVEVSLSAGVTQFRKEDSVRKVINRADGALYIAKDSGRNIVKTEKDLKSSAEETED